MGFGINSKCKELKLRYMTFVYFVTSVFSVILNIVTTKLLHINKNTIRLTYFDAFDFQQIKKLGQSLYNLTFLFFILVDNIIIYLALFIIYGSLLKCIAVTVVQLLFYFFCQWRFEIFIFICFDFWSDCLWTKHVKRTKYFVLDTM